MVNKRLINTGEAAPAPLDPLQNFETVTYTGNGGTQKITGYIRKGAAFNGSSSYIDLNGSVISVGSFSISLWVNWNDVTNQSRAIHLGDGDLFSDISIFALSGNAVVRFADSGSNYRDVSFSVSTNQWYHISMTYDISNNNYKVYLNGTQQGSTIVASGFTTLANYGAIGARIGSGGTSLYMKGSIDQVRIFNKALSQSEVDTLEAETYASSTKSTTDIFNDGSAVALYELDEDANDTGGVNGYIGAAGVFNGSSSKIAVPSTNTTPIDFSTENWSISWWIYLDTLADSKQMIGKWGASPGVVFLFRTKSNGQIEFYERDGSTSLLQSASAGTISAGQWYNMVYSRSATEAKFYLNGSLNKTMSRTNAINQGGTEPINIGGNGSSGIDGKIDQVRIFNRALDETTNGEVTTLYGETSASATKSTTDIFDDGSGVALYELEGNANDTGDTYDGTETNVSYAYDGTPTNVNFLGMAFQPDLVWVKRRTGTASHHNLFDSVRGQGKILYSSTTDQEGTTTNHLTSFDTNGFTTKQAASINGNGYDYVAWCWKAGGSVTPNNNTEGSIASTVSANPDAGFSIVKYSGNSTTGATIGHGLSAAIDLLIVKNLTDGAQNWRVQASPLGGTKGASLNTSDEFATASYWNNTDATDTVFTVDNSTKVNETGDDYIAYCFHSVDGYQKVGSYEGSGTTSKVVTTGFTPRFLMIKNADDTGDWAIFDSQRSPSNPVNDRLMANLSSVESTNSTTRVIDFDATSFELKTSNQDINASGDTYIYLAIA